MAVTSTVEVWKGGNLHGVGPVNRLGRLSRRPLLLSARDERRLKPRRRGLRNPSERRGRRSRDFADQSIVVRLHASPVDRRAGKYRARFSRTPGSVDE